VPAGAALGPYQVLVTCDIGNVGSPKVIEASDSRCQDPSQQRRYWISARLEGANGL
jgi:predicted acetyltransferase